MQAFINTMNLTGNQVILGQIQVKLELWDFRAVIFWGQSLKTDGSLFFQIRKQLAEYGWKLCMADIQIRLI